jgi:hypothetical protein
MVSEHSEDCSVQDALRLVLAMHHDDVPLMEEIVAHTPIEDLIGGLVCVALNMAEEIAGDELGMESVLDRCLLEEVPV